MKAKRFLSILLACALLVSFCACDMKESPVDPTTATTTPTTTTRKIPDYRSTLKQYLGVDPVPSSFDELKGMAQALREPNKFYGEYEEHHCCTLVYNNNKYYVIRYEKAQEWFEYYFTGNDYLSFEDDGRTLIIKDESYTGPEGMLMMYNYRAFVDDSRKYLIFVVGYEYVPEISDSDIKTFKSYIQTWINMRKKNEYT